MRARVAIIGAGISGLTLAQHLKEHVDVAVFEKARGVGGRMSTRYADPFYFDHGTQYFTARSKKFQSFLAPLIEEGLIAPWEGKVVTLQVDKKTTDRLWFEPHYVAAPHMNALCKKLAQGLTVQTNTEIAPLLEQSENGWQLFDKDGKELGAFDWVISTAPPAQTTRLFSGFIAEDSPLHSVQMQGCYTVMIGFDRPWDKPWIAAKIIDNPIKWISINSTKPARDTNVTAIVAHSCNAWADAHMDDDMNEAQAFLLEQFEKVTGIACVAADYLSTHRWKYAIVNETEISGVYVDTQKNLAATSDWASTSRIEDVWHNATATAESIINYLK